MTRANAAVITALQSALAAEDATIFGYGVAGAFLTGARQARAVAYWDQHRAARDLLTAMLRARGAQPVAAGASYRLPFPVHTTAAATALATYLEDSLAAAYLGLVAADDPATREAGALAVRECAVRAATWRGASVAFPGLPARAIRAPARSPG